MFQKCHKSDIVECLNSQENNETYALYESNVALLGLLIGNIGIKKSIIPIIPEDVSSPSCIA